MLCHHMLRQQVAATELVPGIDCQSAHYRGYVGAHQRDGVISEQLSIYCELSIVICEALNEVLDSEGAAALAQSVSNRQGCVDAVVYVTAARAVPFKG